MHKFQVTLSWSHWLIGGCGPHAGMVVWTLCLGPLAISFWPLAPKLTEAPF